ncbi:MAG: SUMF1/EgtB/PvdO family nonheme iron enzyme [Pseudomonadota bacterium]
MSNHRSINVSSGVAGTGSKHRRVLRGGSFNNNPRNVRCAYRNNNDPDNRNNNIGFRVVVSTLFCSSGMAWRRNDAFGTRRMAEPVPGRVPLNPGRANSNQPAPWTSVLG